MAASTGRISLCCREVNLIAMRPEAADTRIPAILHRSNRRPVPRDLSERFAARKTIVVPLSALLTSDDEFWGSTRFAPLTNVTPGAIGRDFDNPKPRVGSNEMHVRTSHYGAFCTTGARSPALYWFGCRPDACERDALPTELYPRKLWPATAG